MPTLAPPPLDSAVLQGDKAAPPWARWLQQLWDSLRVSAVMVKKGASQTIGTASLTKVTWPTEEYDPDELFASDRFTVPTSGTGIYRARSAVHFTDAAGKTGHIDFFLYKNGSLFCSLDLRTSAGAWDAGVSIGGSRTLSLVAGDYLEIFAYHTTGGNLTIIANADYNYFCVERL